ncbi:hypothetical protein [Saccharopolyspora mangrovi]|uniref:RNA polymerase subunit sigma-70 n=1 Tax=Saccharopolyspora mangrovi TaxID=3082379 RepID=A0ABU6ABT4_9PSEU|nr:hypothetical protein [Saccharopolyspora sp. S2-29]MEB3368981.1 hypothetical protein [Saccharopolyspora sp. S2-29]
MTTDTKIADLYASIETVYAARRRFLALGEQDAAEAAERALNQLLNELYTRIDPESLKPPRPR